MPESLHEVAAEDMHDLIGYRPRWIVRYGSSIFLFVFLSIIAATWLIRYPETVPGNARLLAINAPKPIVASVAGRLEKLLVQNEEEVTAGQYLAFLQSTAHHEEVILLKDWIDSCLQRLPMHGLQTLQQYPLVSLTGLGELQSSYQSFQNTVLETSQLLASGYYDRKKQALQKDLRYLQTLEGSTARQQQAATQNKTINEEEYRAYESLAKDKVIAPLELNQYKSKLLGGQQNEEQLKAAQTLNEIGRFGKQKELLDLDKQFLDQQQRFYSGLLQLKSEVEEWMERYIVRAPESGRVFFASALQEQSLLESGQELFFIQPPNAAYYAELWVAQSGMGEIKTGQPVHLEPGGYPVAEYGYIEGTISYIYNLPNRHDSFLLKINLPQGLSTSQHRLLPFRNGLPAKAGIITRNRRLLGRLLQPLAVW